MPIAAREYKDRLFGFIFGSEENREWTLSLYNAVNGTHYDDPSLIEITTIREVLYLGMRNDVSFMITGELNLYEQQSTYNPNMPLRMMQYAGNAYERYLVSERLNKYSSTRLSLPVPKLVVFYNGTREMAEEVTLRLSDSFPEGSDPDIDVRVRMINVNWGSNGKVLASCEALNGYSLLIARIRDHLSEGMAIEESIGRAIDETPRRNVLKGFLETHRAEVMGMLLTEYNEAEAMELFRLEGERRGALRALSGLVEKGLLSLGAAAGQLGMTEEDFRAAARMPVAPCAVENS